MRVDCSAVKLNSKACGEMCILENYSRTILDVEDSTLELKSETTTDKVSISGKAVVMISNNVVSVFGSYKKVD